MSNAMSQSALEQGGPHPPCGCCLIN